MAKGLKFVEFQVNYFCAGFTSRDAGQVLREREDSLFFYQSVLHIFLSVNFNFLIFYFI